MTHYHIYVQSPRIVKHVHPYRRKHVHEGLAFCTSSLKKAEQILVKFSADRRAYLLRRAAANTPKKISPA